MLRSILFKRCWSPSSASSIRPSAFTKNVPSLTGLSKHWSKPSRPLSTAASFALDEKPPISEPVSFHRHSPDSHEPESERIEGSVRDQLPTWLRPYQIDVIETCVKALDRGLRRIGVSSPTGSGKTVMLCV